MPESATGSAARRRITAARRITRCAQELTLAHGFDGFTMAGLAETAGVSRRTLFNYFPGKHDAVLGALPEMDPDLLATFHAGGPSGDLVADLAALARSLVSDQDIDRADARRVRRLMAAEPRLLGLAHERFGTLLEEYAEEVRVREGEAFDPLRARLLTRVLACLFDVALDDFLADPGAERLDELYADLVRRAREALAP